MPTDETLYQQLFDRDLAAFDELYRHREEPVRRRVERHRNQVGGTLGGWTTRSC
jgi:hypothetical protein